MRAAGSLTRAVVKNYKSIAACGIELKPVTFLVGPNGAGKSNFLDALRFVADGLRASLDHALRDRGGIGEVRRRSGGHPTHFGVRLEFVLPDGSAGSYAFRIGAKPNGAWEVTNEECVVRPPEALAPEVRFTVASGDVTCSVGGPAASSDRLYLVSASGLKEFRPVCDALSQMGFYNFSPDRMKDLQPPDPGQLLARDGRNIASALDHIAKNSPEIKAKIEGYISQIVPGESGVDTVPVGPRETLQFRQDVAGAEAPWRFFAANMSDGTLRALGVLVSWFQAGAPIVGLEEPEAGLHPAALEVLLDALFAASASRQIIVTSHSAEFLDSPRVDADSIVAVVADEGSTRAGPLDSIGRDAFRRRLRTAGELLRDGRMRPDRETGADPDSQLTLLSESAEEKE